MPKDIVQQIIEAEKVPVHQMGARQGKIGEKKALVQTLISLVESMRGEALKNKNARSLRELAIHTGDNTDIAVNADKNVAEPGKYSLEVVRLAQKSSAISNGIEDKDKTYLGVGYIRAIMPSGDKKEIYIDQESSSLAGIAKVINKEPDLGFRAHVVNDGKGGDDPWRLIISMTETGEKNKAEFPYIYLVDGEADLRFDNERKAQNAAVKLDGFEIEVPENKITDLIPGVTIDLKKAKPGEEISIEITEDVKKIGTKIGALVENMNNVLKFIKEQNTIDGSHDTSRTLGGDSTLTSIESKIRSAIFTNIQTDSGLQRLGDLGVTFQRDGLLKFDQEKFENVLAKNYKAVSQTLTGKYDIKGGKTAGFVDIIEDLSKSLLAQPSGLLSTRKAGLQSQINQIDRQISTKTRHLTQKEEILKAKFARLEETISRIKSQGAGLASFAGGAG